MQGCGLRVKGLWLGGESYAYRNVGVHRATDSTAVVVASVVWATQLGGGHTIDVHLCVCFFFGGGGASSTSKGCQTRAECASFCHLTCPLPCLMLVWSVIFVPWLMISAIHVGVYQVLQVMGRQNVGACSVNLRHPPSATRSVRCCLKSPGRCRR
jgi:hypothetical protein